MKLRTIDTVYNTNTAQLQEPGLCNNKQQLRIQFHNKPTPCGQAKPVYPSVLVDKQVPVLNLIESSSTSQADLQDAFQSIRLCSHGREETTEDKNTE